MPRAEDLRDLRYHKGEIARFFGQEKPFVLPMPYARGIFRVKGRGLSQPRDCPYFVTQESGFSAFIEPGPALWRAVAWAQLEGPAAPIEPSFGPLHTALYQCLRLRPRGDGWDGELRFLLRAALEVPALLSKRDEDGGSQAAERLLFAVQPRLCAALARALRVRSAPFALLGPARAFAALLAEYGG
ncbi:MAG: hypothetical protein LBD02_07315 [Christensenellaceae bacterium]|jgi:hypothetical protein|nr:hypothetical protein [Christensenellaceae bacterium]